MCPLLTNSFSEKSVDPFVGEFRSRKSRYKLKACVFGTDSRYDCLFGRTINFAMKAKHDGTAPPYGFRISGNSRYISEAFQLLAIGAGIGITVPTMTSVLLGTVEKNLSGIASGVLNSSRHAGSVIGVALFGSFIAQKNRFIGGFHTALLVSTIALLIGSSFALLVRPEPASNSKNTKEQLNRAA